MSRWLVASSQADIEAKAAELEGKKVKFVDTTNSAMQQHKDAIGIFHYDKNNKYIHVVGVMSTSPIKDLEIFNDMIYITTERSKYVLMLVNQENNNDNKNTSDTVLNQVLEYLKDFNKTGSRKPQDQILELILKYPDILLNSEVRNSIEKSRFAAYLAYLILYKAVQQLSIEQIPDYILHRIKDADIMRLINALKPYAKQDRIFKWIQRLVAFVSDDYKIYLKNKLLDKVSGIDPIYKSHWLHKPSTGKRPHIAWKIHLYADSIKDWVQLSNLTEPVINKYSDMDWKMAANGDSMGLQLHNDQAGKAIVLYPTSMQQFIDVVKELDRIYKENDFTRDNTYIAGDKQLGTTGRIFYRYEYTSGKYKDDIIDLSKDPDKYEEIYEENRGSGKYLAKDMSPEDDPFLHLLED